MRGLYEIYKSPDTRAKPECQGFMNRVQTELVHNYFIARKYCVLSQYVANKYINVFPTNTFFNDAYQTISDIQFIATGRVASVTGYNYGSYMTNHFVSKLGIFWHTDNTTIRRCTSLNSAVKSINSGAKSIKSGAKSLNGGVTKMNEPAT